MINNRDDTLVEKSKFPPKAEIPTQQPFSYSTLNGVDHCYIIPLLLVDVLINCPYLL